MANPVFPWIIFPDVKAGPDLRYSVFSCYVKTTWTKSSNSTMYVSAEECYENMRTKNTKNWYKSDASIYPKCQELLLNHRFVHMFFELPQAAPSLTGKHESGPDGSDHIICVTLDSEFGKAFFGDDFVNLYKTYVKSLIQR